MVLGTDLGGGNVDISLVLKVFFEEVCFLCFYYFFDVICCWSIEQQKPEQIVVIVGGQHVDIMLGFIWFSEMRVLS